MVDGAVIVAHVHAVKVAVLRAYKQIHHVEIRGKARSHRSTQTMEFTSVGISTSRFHTSVTVRVAALSSCAEAPPLACADDGWAAASPAGSAMQDESPSIKASVRSRAEKTGQTGTVRMHTGFHTIPPLVIKRRGSIRATKKEAYAPLVMRGRMPPGIPCPETGSAPRGKKRAARAARVACDCTGLQPAVSASCGNLFSIISKEDALCQAAVQRAPLFRLHHPVSPANSNPRSTASCTSAERFRSRTTDHEVFTVVHRQQQTAGAALPDRQRHCGGNLPHSASAIAIPTGPTMRSARRHPTTTAFSPVAAWSAPARSMAAVAALFVPTAATSARGSAFFSAATSCFPRRRPARQ